MSLSKDFSAGGATDAVYLLPGRWTIVIRTGGSTVELQASPKGADDFVTETLPDDTTSTSTDLSVEVPGNLEWRLNVTSYVGAGSIQAIRSSN